LLFASNYYPTQPNIIADVLELRMMLRGMVTESTQNFKSKVMNSKDPEIQNLYQQWLSAKDQYLKVVLMKEEDKRSYDLTSLNNQVNQLEKQLQQKLNIHYKKPQKISWKTVQQKLKPNEAAIEIIRITNMNENLKIDTVYSFIIITPNCQLPELVTINGDYIENHVYQYYFRQIVSRRNIDKKSYQVLWKDILDKSQLLKNYDLKKVYLTCDGVYHKIPLSTLYLPEENRFLGDKIEIVYLLNLKHLLNVSNNVPKTAVLLGYPDYKGKDALPAHNVPEEQLPLPNEQRSLMFRLLDFSEQGIALLPGTKKETDAIQQLLQKQQISTQLYQSSQATEEAVKKLQSPHILHIATHGYFIEDKKLLNSDQVQEDKLKIYYDNPLLRSGLLLANCENDLSQKRIYKNQDDGILTGYEASELNLQNTDLVVLSACQTGLGDAKNEEGVFGLQRAFFLAGAKSLMLSLWSVDDEATQEFMIAFYDAWINQKMNKRNAFYYAQNKIKSQERFANPYYWGAFILIGE
jgi:CHAT domain-containing protein